MDRRGALAYLAGLWLAGCGGGGGGGGGDVVAAAPASAPAAAGGSAPPAAAPAPASSSTTTSSSTAPPALVPPFTGAIAMWGDSMVPPVVRALPPLYNNGREVHDGGFPGETSAMVLGHQNDDTQYRNATTIFWTGHNDVRIDPATAAAQIKANIAADIALLSPGNDRYIILSVLNDAIDGQRGSQRYEVVTQLNRDLAAQYGYHFVDIRSFMVSQSSPNDPQGALDLQADVPSSTLRFDEIHLTGFGADVVAKFIKSILDARGW